jgi:HEAT repeat protein
MSTTKMNRNLVLLSLLMSAASAFGQKIQPLVQEPADKLIAVLKSAAGREEKAAACRQLAVIGGKEAVAALAALLGDEQLNHPARYGLETSPDPAADDALREALGKLQGRPLVGVIGSLGVRRDAKAVKPLAGRLQDADPDVAQAAARALGKIGAAEAANALQAALPKAAAANQLAFCEGLFRCAEALAAKGQRKEALAAYDQLRALAQAPHQVRAAALRGAILTRQKEGLALLRDSLRNPDYILFAAAVRAAQEMPGAEVTQALAAELGKLPDDNRIVAMQALSLRADAAALPALFAATKSGGTPARVAAIRAIAGINHASAVPVLTELMGNAEGEIAQAARESLASLSGPQADAAVLAMLSSPETARRLMGIEIIGRRRIAAGVPALLKAAAGPDAEVRPAALKRLGELAGPAELAALLDLLAGAKTSQDLDAAEQAISAVCAKANDAEFCAQKLAPRLAQAQAAEKAALLRVLTSVGGAAALKALRAAVNDANPEVRAAAIRALGAWKTAEAAPDLLALAKSAANPTDRMLCLRSYLELASNPDLPADQRLTMCRSAGSLTERAEEKKLLLSALGNLAALDSLPLIAPYLDDAATREEACAAVVGVSEKLLRDRDAGNVAAKLVEPLQKVSEATANADMAKRAKSLLERAQRRAKS